jgi:putative NADPH-quinone reductase
MNVSLILAHPNPESLNHAIARTAAAAIECCGHRPIVHDLYAERFDPLLPSGEIRDDAELPSAIAAHCREIATAEGIVIVHPNWWGQPPAILTGWVDRVLRAGVAYRFVEGDAGEGVPVGLLRAQAALVLNTSNTPPEREVRTFGDPLETLWRNCIFGLCGVRRVSRETFSPVVTSSAEERRRWLDRVRELVMQCFAPA